MRNSSLKNCWSKSHQSVSQYRAQINATVAMLTAAEIIANFPELTLTPPSQEDITNIKQLKERGKTVIYPEVKKIDIITGWIIFGSLSIQANRLHLNYYRRENQLLAKKLWATLKNAGLPCTPRPKRISQKNKIYIYLQPE